MAEAALTPAGFAERFPVSRETLSRLETYAALLVRYQRVQNLVGAATLGDVWRRHFLDSAQLMAHLPESATGAPVRLLDVGSGAGFPGLVLAILAADRDGGPKAGLETHLVEANGRKCAFLAEVARRTSVAVRIHNTRIEAMTPFAVDVVTARAVAPLERLLPEIRGFLEVPGAHPVVLLLKGRAAHRELTALGKGWKMRSEIIPSATDPGGVVLRLEDITCD